MIWFDKLLTKSRAFFLGSEKQITQFFTALETVLLDVRDFFNSIYLDIWPDSTTQLDLWDAQFNLPVDNSLTDEQRRQRLDAAWKRTGGQSPRYIQDALQNAGFDVYVYEWWEPNTNPPVARNPFDYITIAYVPPQCGEVYAACGEPSAQCTEGIPPSTFVFVAAAGNPPAEAGNPPAEAGNFIPGTQGEGYFLVNKIYETVPLTSSAQCGETLMQCLEPSALCGTTNTGFQYRRKQYETPSNPDDWRFILYICGPAWNAPALIEQSRRNEFENLLLSICPAQQWLAVQAVYEESNPTVNVYGN